MKKRIGLFSALSMFILLSRCGANTDNAADSSAAVESEESVAASSESVEAVTGASEVTYSDPEELKESYDVIIIGSGGSGMSAAISAKDAGLNPVIFEKMPVHGGNTIKSSAGMNASATKFQEEQGIADSNELFYNETLAGGKNTNDPELLHYLVDNSGPAIDWLDTMGITLDNITVTGGMSVNRTHRPSDGSAVGQYLVEGLYANIMEREIPVFVNSAVTEIVMTDDKASGVKVDFNNEGEITVSSDAVIIATGGFGADFDMVTELAPQLEGYVTTNQPGSTGDGIKMAQAIGAAVVDMDQIQIHPTVHQESSYLITEAIRGEGAILVNQQGERFVNEMETRDTVSAAINALEEGYAYLIFDAGVKDRVKAVNTYIEKGFVQSDETIEALAGQLEMDSATLAQTLTSWNETIASQVDGAFNRTTGMVNPLAAAPYYAIQIAPGIHHTMGGLKINSNAQVISTEGTVIEGLYAAGEVTGGVHGSNRIGGNAVADIIVFGRQAGVQSASYVQSME